MRSFMKSHRKSLSTGSSDVPEDVPASSASSLSSSTTVTGQQKPFLTSPNSLNSGPSPHTPSPPPNNQHNHHHHNATINNHSHTSRSSKDNQKRSFSAISLRSLTQDLTQSSPTSSSSSSGIRHSSSSSHLKPTATIAAPTVLRQSTASSHRSSLNFYSSSTLNPPAVSSTSGSLKKLNPISYIRRRRASTDDSLDQLYAQAPSPEAYRGAGSIFGTRIHDWGSDAPSQTPVFHPTLVFSAPSPSAGTWTAGGPNGPISPKEGSFPSSSNTATSINSSPSQSSLALANTAVVTSNGTAATGMTATNSGTSQSLNSNNVIPATPATQYTFPTTTDAIKMSFSLSVYSSASTASSTASSDFSNTPFSPLSPVSSPTSSNTLSPQQSSLVGVTSDLALVQEVDEEEEEEESKKENKIEKVQEVDDISTQESPVDNIETSEPVSLVSSSQVSLEHFPASSNQQHLSLPLHELSSAGGSSTTLPDYDIKNGSSLDLTTLKKELSTIIRKSKIYEQKVAQETVSPLPMAIPGSSVDNNVAAYCPAASTAAADSALPNELQSCDMIHLDSVEPSSLTSVATPVLGHDTSDIISTPALCISKTASPATSIAGSVPGSTVNESFAASISGSLNGSASSGSVAPSVNGSDDGSDQRSIFSFEEDFQMGRNSSINYHKPVNVLERHSADSPITLHLNTSTSIPDTPTLSSSIGTGRCLDSATDTPTLQQQGLGVAYLDLDEDDGIDIDEYLDDEYNDEGEGIVEDDAHLFGHSDLDNYEYSVINQPGYVNLQLQMTPKDNEYEEEFADNDDDNDGNDDYDEEEDFGTEGGNDDDLTAQLNESIADSRAHTGGPVIHLLPSTPEKPRNPDSGKLLPQLLPKLLPKLQTPLSSSSPSSSFPRPGSPPMPMSQQLLQQQQYHAHMLHQTHNQQYNQDQQQQQQQQLLRPIDTNVSSQSSGSQLASPISAKGLGAMRYLNHSPLSPYMNTMLTSPERNLALSPGSSSNPYFSSSSSSLYLSPSRSSSFKSATSPGLSSPSTPYHYNPLHHNHHQTQYFNGSHNIYSNHVHSSSTVSFDSTASSKYYSASEGEDDDIYYASSSFGGSRSSSIYNSSDKDADDAPADDMDYDSLLDEVNAVPEDYGDSDDENEIFNKPMSILTSRFAGPTLDAVPASPPSESSPLAQSLCEAAPVYAHSSPNKSLRSSPSKRHYYHHQQSHYHAHYQSPFHHHHSYPHTERYDGTSSAATTTSRRARTNTISSSHAPTSLTRQSSYRGLRKTKSLSFDRDGSNSGDHGSDSNSRPTSLSRQTSVIKNKTTTTTLFSPMPRAEVERYYRAVAAVAVDTNDEPAVASTKTDTESSEAFPLSKKSSTGSASSTDSRTSAASASSAESSLSSNASSGASSGLTSPEPTTRVCLKPSPSSASTVSSATYVTANDDDDNEETSDSDAKTHAITGTKNKLAPFVCAAFSLPSTTGVSAVGPVPTATGGHVMTGSPSSDADSTFCQEDEDEYEDEDEDDYGTAELRYGASYLKDLPMPQQSASSSSGDSGTRMRVALTPISERSCDSEYPGQMSPVASHNGIYETV
ncbi:uncharacterized protein SAPINGB_P000950 [Magnusiomyces paraingens]|uniref:Uncharacterized protein n=1 Tax=Magnusiomyces paraingens TaxID=2606893 RepID=A0A5E8B360_9ASCO|nr:uncharacterized protein SAPINGB_P000950 [Saprochaete ingens]VVT45906.1 unnamed protein product [Saprochaete ingens]